MEEVVPLSSDHDTEGFDSGSELLDSWLKAIALQAGFAGTAKTFVLLNPKDNKSVIGYYSLASASLATEDALDRIRAGTGKYPIPAVILARLAVKKEFQGRGIGKLLIRDAVLRVLRVREEIGIRVFLIHAIDDEAKSYYQSLGFSPAKFHPRLLMALIKDLRKMVSQR